MLRCYPRAGMVSFWAAVILGLAAPGVEANQQIFRDPFSSYRGKSDPEPAWEAQAAGWQVVDGALQGDDGMCVWRAVPWASSVRFSCDVKVLEGFQGDWLTTGIGLQIDEENYWGLNLVKAPENRQRRHSTEMQEMLGGVWLAQAQPSNRLQVLEISGGEFNWKAGEIYRLILELTPTNITGVVQHQEKTVSRFAYRLDAPVPAVRLGIPMVRASGLRARFDNAEVVVSAVAAKPEEVRPAIPGWVSRPGKTLGKGTGFFRTFQDGERWWLLDPEGKPFFDVGVDHVSYHAHWCEALGYAPYHRNVAAKYGNEAAWGAATLERLRQWSFNCLPAGHSPSLRHQGLAHIEFASFGTSFAKREWICRPIHWTGFPDVFSPRWESHCRILARRMARTSKGDPWCIGTFLDNELEWYGKNGSLVDEVFQLPPSQAAKQTFYAWLLERFQSIEEINRQLGTDYSGRASFLSTTNVPVGGPGLGRVREEFLAVIAERYFSVAGGAMRAADPDHLVLGCRFAGRVPEAVLEAAGKHNDAFTINTYPRVDFESAWTDDGTGGAVEGVPRQFSDYYQIVRKPMIVTEWSFPALDSGLPCKHGAGMRVDTQEQKAACYRIFANAMADLPFIVGYHYFMWADEPALGISSTFPEDSNYGLVNEKDEPYGDLTRIAAKVNASAAERHSRSRSSGLLDVAPSGNGIEVVNTNACDAHGRLLIVREGKRQLETVQLRPKQRRVFKLPGDKPWWAELQNWDGTRKRVLGGAVRAEQFTLLSTSARKLNDVPVVLEGKGTPQALLLSFSPGQAIGRQEHTPNLRKAERVALAGNETTWACERRSGALFDRIESSGLALGRLVFAVHQKVQGRDYWVESTRINAVEMEEQAHAWVVEAEVEFEGAATGPAGYRARVQAVVFKERGVAMVRPLWVESTDARAWQFEEAFWFCRSAIGGADERDVVGGPGVPMYYHPANFITDEKLGGCFGSLAGSDWKVLFWTNPEGGIHPDSSLPVHRGMEQGIRWASRHAPFLWVYASRQSDGWKKAAQACRDSGQIVISRRN